MHWFSKRLKACKMEETSALRRSKRVLLSPTLKKLLVYHCCHLESTAEFVMINLFGTSDNPPSLQYLEHLWEQLKMMTPEERNKYADYKPTISKEKMIEKGSQKEQFLELLLSENRSIRLKTLTQSFHNRFYEQYKEIMNPSISTVYRALKMSGNTHKKVSYRNIHANPQEQLAYLQRMMPINWRDIVDVDGMVQTTEDFRKKYGWSHVGEECVRMQITIGTKTYAAHAAYSYLGFIHWKIFDDVVTDEEVMIFLNELKSRIDPERTWGLFDNASNQRTDAVRHVMGEVFREKYVFCSPYSPWLKPCEHGFAKVKRYIQERDDIAEYLLDPERLINEAFTHYMVGQPGGLTAANDFAIYRDNNELHSNLSV